MTKYERIAMWVAWRLPRKVAMWAYVRVATADYGGNPTMQTVDEPLDRWEGRPRAQYGEPLGTQVARLADYIMFNVPGEPSESAGAVDTAIRILSQHYPPLAPVQEQEAK